MLERHLLVIVVQSYSVSLNWPFFCKKLTDFAIDFIITVSGKELSCYCLEELRHFQG